MKKFNLHANESHRQINASIDHKVIMWYSLVSAVPTATIYEEEFYCEKNYISSVIII